MLLNKEIQNKKQTRKTVREKVGEWIPRLSSILTVKKYIQYTNKTLNHVKDKLKLDSNWFG